MKKNLMVRRLMTLAMLMILHSSLFTLSLMAQKFALLDMDYILSNIPAYERANEQLNQMSKKWQAEVDALQTEAQTLYKLSSSPTSRRKPVRRRLSLRRSRLPT